MSASSPALQRLQASRQRLAGKLQGRHGAWPAGAALAADAGDSLLRPLAQQHPFALTATAFAGGAALVAFKPWRAVGESALLSRLAAQWTSQLASQLPLSALLAAAQDAALSYIATGSTPMPPAAGEP